MGLERPQYLRLFDRANLLYQHPGRSRIREDHFPAAPARVAAEAMRPLLREREVLLVGRRVANAFHHRDVPFLEWRREARWRYWFAVLPHTSGRNHWYNAEANREAARAFLESFVDRLQKEVKLTSALVEEGVT